MACMCACMCMCIVSGVEPRVWHMLDKCSTQRTPSPQGIYIIWKVASLNQFIKSSSTNFISALQNPVPSLWQFEISCGRSIYHRHWQKNIQIRALQAQLFTSLSLLVLDEFLLWFYQDNFISNAAVTVVGNTFLYTVGYHLQTEFLA